MGADSSAENTPNTLKFICQFVCPSQKVWDFDEKKASLGVRIPCPVVYRRTVEGQKILQILKLNKKTI